MPPRSTSPPFDFRKHLLFVVVLLYAPSPCRMVSYQSRLLHVVNARFLASSQKTPAAPANHMDCGHDVSG